MFLDTLRPVFIVCWSSLEILKKGQRNGKVLGEFDEVFSYSLHNMILDIPLT